MFRFNRKSIQPTMKKSLALCIALFVSLAATASFAAPQKFKPDNAHSSVTFKIRHFFTPVHGSFAEFDATIIYDATDLANCSVTAQVKVPSVDTNNEDRDDHLNGEDFFNAPENPEIAFESTSWTKKADNEFTVEGNLSMAGETKPVTLDVTLLGIREKDGKMVSGWEVSTTLDRRDWGITYGQGVVGNEVTVDIAIQAPEA